MQLNRFISGTMQKMPTLKRPKSVSVRVEGSPLIHMGLNENPYGISPKAMEAVRESLESAKYYPDFSAADLKAALSELYGLGKEQIVTGSGSSSMIDMLGVSFLEPGDEVLFCVPTFGAFVEMAYVNGAVPVTVPLTAEQKFDLDGMMKAVTDKTKMVVICNPNNPTGTYLPYAEIEAFLRKLPDTVLTVMDEAYVEFSTQPDCRSMVSFLKENPDFPIMIIKTFSKYYGMAGLRCGYALGPAELIAAMQHCTGAWNLNVFAHKAAVAALGEQEYYQKTKALIVEGREYITRELRALGCKVFDSQTNFVYFDTGHEPFEIQEKLVQSGIHIESFAFSRVSVGTLEECRLFIEKMKEILA
jgi:histidinol-phosphate aminotransferase